MSDPTPTIDVVFAIDRAFLPFLAVASWSALRQTRPPLHIHVLQDGSLGEGAALFRRMVAAQDGGVTFYRVDDAKFDDLPVTEHVSRATYYRLSVAELLPTDIQRVIYLDADLIVRSCLSELYQWPTQPSGVAAVPEASDSSRRLGLSPVTPYFNAGVLVLDLDCWRRQRVTEQLHQIARCSREKLRFWDQDVLALFLQGRFSYLPSRWNVTHRCFVGSPRLPLPARPPGIVHFSGDGLKPWDDKIQHPYFDEFWQLAEQVAPFGFELHRPHRNGLLDRLRSVMHPRRRSA